jgi:predicted ATPase
VAVDLYAVGVMGFELFAGQHPFTITSPRQLINDILYTPADLALLDVGDEVKDILGRLLEKSPDNRYESAYDVIQDLSRTSTQPIQLQTVAIRESFLQAARFVGREKEINLLAHALDDTFEHRGSAWLVAGESGVGKSRLVDELRVRAMVRGALVLSGQGVTGGGLSYHLWREPLRQLMLSADLSDTDAGVLKPIVVDIEELLGREIPDVPELEGQTGQQRLLTTIASIFRQQRQPIVLILEDLQWVEESLEVLEALIPMIPDLALLIIGSYRNDERPDLPERLPGMSVIRLERLSDKGIEQLSQSMLGDAGRQPHVVQLLKKETEGNVFFLVEVVRALAEQAGSLDNIGYMTIPHRVFAGGVEQVVRNRLKRMPTNAIPLLNLAAVAGRQIDLNLLSAVKEDLNLDEWLTACSSAAVLDVMDGHWRFAHDKLRESILSSLREDELRVLHRQVALALETVYADAKDDYAMIIADHYEAAGESARLLEWSVRAAKHSDESYAPVTAINYYRKALALWSYSDTLAPGSLVIEQLKVYERLGELLAWQSQYAEAIESFAAMRMAAEATQDIQAQSAAWYGIARTQTYQGEMRTALESATRSEKLARAGSKPVELAQALWMRGWISFRLGNVQTAQELAEQVLAISRELNQPSLMGNSLNLLGAINSMLGHYPESATYFEDALETFQKLGLRVNAMSIVNNLGWLAENRGDYQQAFARYQDALEIARDTGHRDAEMIYLSNLGGMRVILGDYAIAEDELRQVISMSEVSGLGVLSETYRNLAEACLNLGKVEDAFGSAKRALELGRGVESQEYIASAWRVLGQVAAERKRAGISPNGASDKPEMIEAVACFTESLRVSGEASLEAEKARTLRAWARYEIAHGDADKGISMWAEAQQIFSQLGAELEAQRMQQLPQ